ncbi:MAG: T9SS type A sorting domain-containing protein [Bacteroidia bacterium]
MKKILYTFMFALTLLICSEQKSSAQVPPGITILGADDSTWNQGCSVPDTLDMFIYGTAGGYLITDSVTIYFAFGDGTDTTFYSLIPQNYFWANLSHIYTLPGIYSLQCIVTGPDGDVDTLTNNNTVIVSTSCGNITGNVYYDANGNCVNDAGDFPIRWAWVKVLYNGNYIAGSYSYINGDYSISVPAGFTYTLEVSYYNNANLTATCPAGGTYTITSLPATNRDFGISCSQTGQDLAGNLWVWGVRPGLSAFIYPDYWNNACTAVSGTVTITLPVGVTYVTANPVPSNVNGQVITYNAAPYDFYWNYQWQYNHYIEVAGSPNLVIGDTLCFEMVLDPIAGDLNPSDNTITTCVPVRNSCDPNEKFESHAKWNTADIAPGTQLDYTVGFQNVGNDVAYQVVVVDTLDSDADVNTLEITGSSHPMNIYMVGTNVLKFEFDNINLAAASVNEALSHGFVTYKIHPKAGLADGTMIDNKADIFFDFNGSIVTNKVTDVIDIALGVNEIISPLTVTAYPNPATEYIRIKLDNEQDALVRLTDLSGRIVVEQIVQNNGMIKVKDLSSGVYTIQITSGERNYTGKVIIK